MSLTVSPELLERAETGPVDDADFVACIKESLPYAYEVVERVAGNLTTGNTAEGRPFADNQLEPPTEQARGQLLRALASDAIRGALERHFGVRLAFQNCHRVAAFPTDRSADDALRTFTSVRAQLLNQSPELVNC
jgi:hypothetical protein